jgi:branched-chain amino acid transport system ATP-binding protein
MLVLKNVQANYGYITALKDVSLEVPQGQIVTLLGANGAGKSTTLKAISGLVRPTIGSITLNNEEIHQLDPAKIVARGVVHVPEGRQVFPDFTVYENLRVGGYRRPDQKNLARDMEKVFSYFPILKERQKQRAGTLSGGEQQMLAIGRGLMAAPKVLLLDEPSLGLAPIVVRNIFKIIQSINQEEGVTILLVEQNAYQALGIANFGYILETGKVKLSGSAATLKHDPEVASAYLGGH